MKKLLVLVSFSLGLFACGDGHAAAPAPLDSVNAKLTCQLVWEQHEAAMNPADRLGNPFPMLSAADDDWNFELQQEGPGLLLVPAQTAFYEVEGDAGTLTCEVPLSWKVLDSRLEASFDPQLTLRKQLTIINGQPFGSEARGGLFLRHQLLPRDPNDINLAWFLKSPALKEAELIQRLRSELKVPVEQSIEVLQAQDLLQARGRMGIQAIAMTVAQDPWKHWAIVAPEASQLWPELRFLPLGQATAEVTAEQAWTQAKILDLAALKLWDVNQKKLVDCATIGTATRPACRQVVDDAFVRIFKEAQEKNAELCIHLAFPGGAFSPYFISSFCLDASGSVQPRGTQAVIHPGFPPATPQGQ